MCLSKSKRTSASSPAPRAGRQLSSSFSLVRHTSDNLTDSMEKSIEFSVINQAANGEKTLTERLMSMVDPVTERRPHRSTIGQARCSDAADRTPTGTPKMANITDRSLERRISVLAHPKKPGSCSKQSCGHHHQRSVCPQNASLAAKQLTPVRRVLQLNNSHHRIVHYSSSSDSEDEQEEEMQNTQNGETSSSPDLFLPVADLHINDNHNDIGFDYNLSNDYPLDLNGRPSSLYTSIPQAGSRASTRATNRVGKKKNLRSSIFSTDTPGKQGPSTAGRRRDDTLWTNQSNMGVDDTNNEEPEPATTRGRTRVAKNETMVLATRKVIKPSVDEAAERLRRSTRNRARPSRGWLGEKPIYRTLANGDRELVGFTEVEIKEKRFVKTKTADPRLATERERQVRMQMAKMRKARKLRELMDSHKRDAQRHRQNSGFISQTQHCSKQAKDDEPS